MVWVSQKVREIREVYQALSTIQEFERHLPKPYLLSTGYVEDGVIIGYLGTTRVAANHDGITLTYRYGEYGRPGTEVPHIRALRYNKHAKEVVALLSVAPYERQDAVEASMEQFVRMALP